jgi:hypothetical protein
VHVSEALLDYVQALVAWSRERPGFGAGLSPRAAIALLRSARAWALLDGRKLGHPEDVQAVTPAVVGHRLRADGESAGADAGERLVAAVPDPLNVVAGPRGHAARACRRLRPPPRPGPRLGPPPPGPDGDPVVLHRRRIYILPTALGARLRGMSLFGMLLASMNYNNNMGFALTFLLAGSAS